MTVIVGVRCSDGVVIGADSVATSAHGTQPLIHLPSNSKIQIFQNCVIVAATGAVGYSQRLTEHIEAAIAGGVFNNMNWRECTTNISRRVLSDLQNSLASRHPTQGIGYGALLAAAIQNEPCLVEYGTTDFQPEIKTGNLFFVTMGSGQVLADPFFAFVTRVLWGNQMPDVERGKFGVYWVLDHTIKLAPGGVGGPIKLAVLRQINGQWKAEEIDTQEAAEYINALETHIGQYAPQATIEQAPTNPIPEPPAA